MSDYLDPNNEELLKDFFAEAQMQVDTLEQNILVLESSGANKDAVDEIFRAAHTLKGGSATVEMMELSHFTHIVEDVLDAIRSDKVGIDESVVDILLSAIDVIKAMIGKRMEGAVYQEDTSVIHGKLSALLPESEKNKKGAAPPPPKAAPPPPQPVSQAAPAGGTGPLTSDELDELREAVDGGMPIYKVSVNFDKDSLMNTVGGIQVYAALKSMGTVLRTVPEFEALYEDNFFPVVDYYFATNSQLEDIRKKALISDVSLGVDIQDIGKAAQTAAPAAAAAAPPPAAAPVQQAAPAQTPAAQATVSEDSKKAGKEAGAILRVDSKRIDDLLNLVSETVITKATFNQINNQFNTMQSELHTIQANFREKIKNLFDSLPGYLDNIQAGKSVKDIRKQLGEE